MTKDKAIKLKCPKCGKSPKKDKSKSNKNWNVYDSKCPECNVYYKVCSL